MASIPELQRIQPVKSIAQNDRINMRAQDQGANILAQTNAVAAVGEKGADMYQMYQADKINQISDVAEQEYTKWNNDQLLKLKNHQGDPTDAYAEYDKQVEQKKKDMISARPDFGEDVMTAVTNRLGKTISQQSIQADHQRGQQQEIYDNNVFESTVKMKRDSFAVNAGYIQKGDPTSLAPFESSASDLATAISKRGIKQGTVTVLPEDAESYTHKYIDDDGKEVKVNMSPIAKSRLFKEMSTGVKDSLDVLIATGRTEEARELQSKYKGYLTPSQTAKIENKFKSEGRKTEAYNVIDSLRGADQETQVNKIESIQDPELRSEILKIKDSDDRRITNIRTRKEKANYDRLGDYVLKKMSSDNPYTGVIDLENDPDSPYAKTFENLSVKQKQAIHSMVEAPKTSDMASVLDVQNLFIHDEDGQDISTMSEQDFALKVAKLSKSDKTYYTRKFFAERTQSEGERRAMNKSAGKILKDRLVSNEIITPKRDGKLSADDQETLVNSQRNLIDFISKNPHLKDDAKISEYVKENVADIIKGKLKSPAVAKTIPSTRQPGNSDTISITKRQLVDFQREYKRVNKSSAFPKPSDPAFEAYIKSQLKR